MDKYKRLSLETKRKQQRVTLTFLSVLLLGFIATTTVLNTTPDALAQTTTTPTEPSEKKDIFKVIMTVQGLDLNCKCKR
jgi:hypothetical protein